MKHSPGFWQSKNRRFIFIMGVIVLVVGAVFVIYNQLVVSQWKETAITSKQPTGEGCKDGERYVYTYEVSGRQYQMMDCAGPNATVNVVTYDPDEPSRAIVNTFIVWQVIASGAAIMGIVLVLGAIFTTDPKPGQLGYTPDQNSR